jgi:hypothetical protein
MSFNLFSLNFVAQTLVNCGSKFEINELEKGGW